MSIKPGSQAKVALNVRVVVGKPAEDGIMVRIDKKFKNTATRLMTESICNYLAGSENTYKRGKGRPNYMGIGTMGITRQPFGLDDKATVAENFSDTIYIEGETTRPWFESTSLALTTVCGAVNVDDTGNTHFWDPALGWGKDGFTGQFYPDPIFQGELCTNQKHTDGADIVYDDIGRIPILRADVLSDCPADWDYGIDGYSSQVVFYGYASVEWVHNLLKPSRKEIDPDTQEVIKVPVGPQLDIMAISEFGLYEKTNTDPHGLETMLAGFRVPSEDDLVYVTDGEVILIEWRVSVRAIMPSEGIGIATEPAPTGIAVYAAYLGENSQQDKLVQMSGVVRGQAGVRQGILWHIDNDASTLSSNTHIDDNGMLVIGSDEQSDVIYVSGSSVVDPFITSKSAITTGLLKDFVTGVSVTTEAIEDTQIQFRATVLGRGTFLQDVTWSFDEHDRPDNPNTTIDNNGLLTFDEDETASHFKIIATSVQDTSVYSIAVVVRTDKTAGTYVISDFTILTEDGE